MRKFMFLVVVLAGLGSRAMAYENSYDKGFSTWSVTGVTCTTGTAVEITATLSGYNLSLYRFFNLSGTNAYVGDNANVSTVTTAGDTDFGFLGFPVLSTVTAPGTSSVDINLGWDPDLKRSVRIFCKAIDSAGVKGVKLVRAVFGYR